METVLAPTASVVHARCHSCECYIAEICDGQRPAGCRSQRSTCRLESPSDEELIERHLMETSCSAPLVSFGVLFDRYHRHVVAWACRMTGNYELARDLAQDVFVKVLTRIDAFRGESRFTTWLYTVTRNTHHDHLKARMSRPREDGAALPEHVPVAQNDALATLQAESAAQLVRRLIRDARLDPIEARAFCLHYGGDVSLQAVTAQLGLTNQSGARARIVSAKRKLRRSAERWERSAVRIAADASTRPM